MPTGVESSGADAREKVTGSASGHVRHPKVLFLSKSFPNKVFDVLGLWVENLVRHSVSFCQPKVISPVPYCPPLPGLPEYYARLRTIPRRCAYDGVEVFYPRYLVGPGYSLRAVEWATYYLAVRRQADQLRREFPFDLIHAHFTYPDGCAAVRLGRRFQVPVIITEHVPWGPWMDSSSIVLQQAIRAVHECALLVAVSSSVRNSILEVIDAPEKIRVIPNAVDGTIFTLPAKGQRRISNQIVFVGAIRPVKGVDILLRAMRVLKESGREVHLLLVGESFFKNYQREYERIRRMTQELDLDGRVEFVGKQQPVDVVRYVQESAVLVLPSRAESFGMVLVEALACGTPVVATRCGGPEDIVNDRVGVLVPPEDPQALATAIAQVLDRRNSFAAEELRSYALRQFGLDAVGARLKALYDEALGIDRQPSA
jgi:teichuronic acid biosynthesis glycosyltransferase TuaC